MKKATKICAIVVTYNRKKLLVETIEALLAQDYDKFDIMIIDNASTDGTKEYIERFTKNPRIHYFNTDKNIGGAGGFNYGLKKAYEMGYDRFWLMDDDCVPTKNALSSLVAADDVTNGEFGFLSSLVLFTDGSPCMMNRQKIDKDWRSDMQLLQHSMLRTYFATFVSFYLTRKTIQSVGYPIREFFIWSDDIEYSGRIAKHNKCYIVGESVVAHNTSNNVGSNIKNDDGSRLDRYRYAFRNEVFIARQNGLKGRLRQFTKVNYYLFSILFSRSSHKFAKIRTIFSGTIRGIFFRPKIEGVDGKRK